MKNRTLEIFGDMVLVCSFTMGCTKLLTDIFFFQKLHDFRTMGLRGDEMWQQLAIHDERAVSMVGCALVRPPCHTSHAPKMQRLSETWIAHDGFIDFLDFFGHTGGFRLAVTLVAWTLRCPLVTSWAVVENEHPDSIRPKRPASYTSYDVLVLLAVLPPGF